MYPWAPFRSTKAAIKLHTLLDVRGAIPSFIHISDGKTHDVNALDELIVEPGAFYLFDRGYLDFARLHALHEAGAFFLIRAKRGLRAKRRYSHAVDRVNTPVLCDQTVTLEVFYSRQGYPTALRRVVVKDDEGKRIVFLTNNTRLPPEVIGELYRLRWQVELFFDCLPYCTPSHVIECQGSADPRPALTGFAPPGWRGIHRDRLGEWSTERCDRLAWQ